MSDFETHAEDHEHLDVIEEYRVVCEHCPIAEMLSKDEEAQGRQVVVFQHEARAERMKELHDDQMGHKCRVDPERRVEVSEDADPEDAAKIGKHLFEGIDTESIK